ncbi:Forkhead-associated (FHA) domain [Trinorchestia longiramus]|nr:Forkhead-associated (FHA) domain [Trinorchestia longiramus]
MSNHYDVPKWAGKPAVGLHLDVAKGDRLIQKLMVDEKKCYLFGRNPQLNDFCIDHASCSRVHSVLVYHKVLQKAFLVDLGSTHGTYIGKIRLEANKPTQVPLNSTFHFGASTRMYTLRERPQTAPKPVMEELERMPTEDGDGALMGLPETETELDNLTEFNTAHNRRITMLGIDDEDTRPRKRHKFNISFKDDEDIINPEDIDPSIGRFRNLLQTTVVPNKKRRIDAPSATSTATRPGHLAHRSSLHTDLPTGGLYEDLPPGDGGDLMSSPPPHHHTLGNAFFSPFISSSWHSQNPHLWWNLLQPLACLALILTSLKRRSMLRRLGQAKSQHLRCWSKSRQAKAGFAGLNSGKLKLALLV